MLNLFTNKYRISSDEELMLLVLRGNEKGLEELYRRYAKQMLNFFFQRLNRDHEKAQDFLQDLFLKLIEKSSLYDSNRKFKIWLYCVAANMCKNEYRRAEVRGIMVDNLDGPDVFEKQPDLFLENKFDRNLFSARLSAELARLDANHSLTFTLRYQEHLSVKEISQIMECSEGTVKSRIFYTLRKLSHRLDMFNPYKVAK